jgi:hypothetical protein
LPKGSFSMERREEWVREPTRPSSRRPSAAVIRKTLQLGVPQAWRSSRDKQIVCYRAEHIICYAHAGDQSVVDADRSKYLA